MESLFHYLSQPSPCGYLPEQTWRLEYEMMGRISAAEYQDRMRQGWRRFGGMLFRPRCPACQACRPLRVLVEKFQPNRSQRRVGKMCQALVEVRMGMPRVSKAKLDLHDRFHAFQTDHKGWPEHDPKGVEDYVDSFVNNPFPTQEWCYYVEGKLVGVGYVDDLPDALSAIYFFYDPNYRHLSLGTWNVLSILDQAAQRGIPHLYLGYYVAGCRSMEYKRKFRPNEMLGPDGAWSKAGP